MRLPKLPDRLKDEYGMPPFLVGDLVHDDLTGETVKVLEVIKRDANSLIGGYRLEHEFLDGFRHAWEVSLPLGVWDET